MKNKSSDPKETVKSRLGSNESNPVKNEKKSKFLTIFICIFLSIVVVLGGVMGGILAFREARTVVKYDGVTMTEGVVNFFISRYKSEFFKTLNQEGVTPYDTDYFWSKTSADGEKYSDRFERDLKNYLSSIVAANRIFKSYGKLSADDKACIKRSAEQVLELHAGGSVETFNSMAKQYGFNYKDFEKASEMLYCAELASILIYGQDGKNLSSSAELCAEFLSTYSHVRLAFIRTETKLVISESEDGGRTEQILPLTDAEKQERAALIERARLMIENRNGESGGEWIGITFFEQLQKDYDSDPDMNETGYYFREGAFATAEFSEEFPEVVSRAYGMKIGEFAMVDVSFGVCVLYKEETTSFAYLDTENPFFSDFYSDGAEYFYTQNIIEFSSSVIFTDNYTEKIRPLSIPKNNKLYIRSWLSG